MKNRWKKVTALGMAVTITLGMAACGGQGNNSGKEGGGKDSSDGITLTFWNGFTSTDGDVLTDIVNEYNETNDKNVTIKMDIMPWDNFNEKLPPAIAAGNAPDFVLISNGYMPPDLEAESFVDMSGFWDYEGVNKADFKENVLEMLQYDGVQLGIPMQVISHYLYWDKDLFEAAGLDPDTPPSSFEEIAEYAKKLTDPSKNQYGFLMAPKDQLVPVYAMWNFGGGIVNEEETESTLSSTENIKAFQWMQDLYSNGVSPSDSDDNTYISGQAAMFINGPWIINGLRENEINFGVAPVPPAEEGGEPSAVSVGVGFSIPKSTDKSKYDAIYDFIKYWNTQEVCKKWTQECGTPPYLYSVLEDPDIANDELTQTLSIPLDYAKINMKKTGSSQALNDAVTPAVEEIDAGADVEETLKKYDSAVEELLKQYN